VVAVVATVVPLSALLACSVGVMLLLRRQKRRRQQPPVMNGRTVVVDPSDDSDDDEEFGEEADFEKRVGPRRYYYRELAAATGNFAAENKFGSGGFGTGYRGYLAGQDRHVAVKVLSPEASAQGRGSSRPRSGSSASSGTATWSSSSAGARAARASCSCTSWSRRAFLAWPERYRVAVGLGAALAYLHEEWEQYVVHGDIKPSNVMLDASHGVKLGDFGLARLLDHGAGARTTRVVMGTMGYMDPDLVSTHRPTCTASA
jgi:serine/threonine protein kinase